MKFEACREFELVLVESIYGVAHVVIIAPFLSKGHFDRFRRKPSDDVLVCMPGWKRERFYVNRFYAIRSTAFKSEKQE